MKDRFNKQFELQQHDQMTQGSLENQFGVAPALTEAISNKHLAKLRKYKITLNTYK